MLLMLALVFSTFRHVAVSKVADKAAAAKENPAKQSAPVVVRVGAIYYDDDNAQYSAIDKILSSLAKRDRESSKTGNRELVFKLAVGTYDEVLDWYESGQIDLAIMNPGPVALLLHKDGNAMDDLFVGIRKRQRPACSFAGANGTDARAEYNSLMLVNRTAPPQGTTDTIEWVKAKARQHQVHFFFVHPFSTSGYIFPRAQLHAAGVALNADDYEITYSHDVSTAEVAKSAYDKNGRLNVAFVSDETCNTRQDNKNIIATPLNHLIVQDALLLTPDFAHKEPDQVDRVKQLLRSKPSNTGPDAEQSFNLEVPPDWKDRYKLVETWINEFTKPQLLMSSALTIDQIIRRINNYNLHHDTPARVAVVLSGGGAKCAYQLGAVELIEDKLAAAQSANQKKQLGIDLVVGTSGGAINALTVAAGATMKDSPKRDALSNTWKHFGQSEILKPSSSVRRWLGATFGFLISFSVFYVWYVLLQRKRILPAPQPAAKRKLRRRMSEMFWYAKAGIVLLCLSLILYLAGQIKLSIPSVQWFTADFLLRHHIWIHVIEYGRQSLRWMALAMFICGILLCIAGMRGSQSLLEKNAKAIADWRWAIVVAVISMAFLLPLIVIYTSLHQDSLFLSEGIQQKMAFEMPPVLDATMPPDSSRESLEKLSSQIIRDGLIKRDLVITGSVLPRAVLEPTPTPADSEELNLKQEDKEDKTDLYFFYRVNPKEPLPDSVLKDGRFVDLRATENQSILLDAVIGSGAIYPAFEPREIPRLKKLTGEAVMENVSIVDGGFVHNSPIDAAVQLDATHIIVIEASPEDRPSQRRGFISNVASAFNYLFSQAQLLDVRSRRQAEVFTLRPATPVDGATPYLCTLDFGEGFINYAMDLGRSDAKRAAFKRQPRPAALD